MNLKNTMAGLEAKIKERENTDIKKEVKSHKRPLGKHSDGLGIKMSNALISATHSLNLNERRLIYLAMAKLKTGSEVSFNAKDFAEAFGLSEKNAYTMISEACDKLFEREIQFQDGRKKGRARWVQEAIYHEGEGWATLKFTDIVKTNIKGLQNQYTKYSLEQAGNLKSVYSWRFLERFIQYGDAKKSYKGWWVISIIELTSFLELSEYYLEWPKLRQKIILPAMKELDEKDGWKVNLKPIKTGRKVTSVRFEFRQDPQGRLEL